LEDESRPLFRSLDHGEIEAILARNHVGRIGYERSGRVEVQPIHYVYSDGWIYGRTSVGSKYEDLTKTAYRWWPVVFEVDEVEDLFNWRSVLVRGGFYLIDPVHAPNQQADWNRAVELLRTLVPETLRDRDPVPFRTAIFRISMQEATGREAIPPVVDAPDPSA
jgi:nitroimidazol reductase NimA-like FMN-containing flavoprotein (pyridoxamine 5'-phosphate oxidase superfamily)